MKVYWTLLIVQRNFKSVSALIALKLMQYIILMCIWCLISGVRERKKVILE